MTPEREPSKSLTTIQSIEELMAHAYAIEAEAEARYRVLAVQMEMHNNREVAALFRTLEKYEGQHAREIDARATGMSLPVPEPWEFKWADAESPELVDSLSMHYLMSPRMVLARALQAERQAFAFFNKLASSTTDPAISDMAKNFAADEQEHISMIKNLLAKLEYPPPDWDDDLDPPVALE